MKRVKKYRYFQNKSVIYDYAILLHSDEPYTSGKPILIIVDNNTNVTINYSNTEEGAKVIREFVKSWSNGTLLYKEVKPDFLMICPSIKDKIKEILDSINEEQE